LDPFYLPLIRAYAFPALATNVAIDMFITCTVSYKLYKSKAGFLEETDSLLTKLLALTWEAATPPALSAILNMIFYIALPRKLVYIFFNVLTPRLYVFSFMHTLNSRPLIRNPSTNATSNEGTVSNDGVSRRRTTMPSTYHLSSIKKGNQELRSFSGIDTIPIHIQTETVIHTAPTDEYDRKKSLDDSELVHDLSTARPVLKISGTPMEASESDSWSLASSVTRKRDKKNSYQMYGIAKQEDAV